MKKIILFFIVLLVVAGGVGFYLVKKQESSARHAQLVEIAKEVPEIQELLGEFPKASIRVRQYSRSYVERNGERIAKECNLQDTTSVNLTAGVYYRVTMNDSKNGLDALAWVNGATGTVECSSITKEEIDDSPPISNDVPRPPASSLIFKSGFEQGVSLGSPQQKQAKAVADWRVDITGSDTTQGAFNWDTLPGELYYAVPASENLGDYVENKIENVMGPGSKRTNALFMGVKDYYRNKAILGGLTRNQYVIYPDESFDSAYSRYWIKFQPDLKKIMPKGIGAWRIVMEWFENGNDYRWNLALLVDSKGELYWKANGERNQGAGWNIEDWRIENHDVPVPIGEWFLLESFFKHSEGADGRVWFAVNGKTIADYKGRNKINGKIETWLPLKVYTGEAMLDRGAAYQWIDDIEIYSQPPLGRF